MKPQPLVKYFFACLLTSGVFLSSCTKQDSVYEYPVNPNPAAATLVNVELTSASSSFDYKQVNIDIEGMEYNISNEAGTLDGWEEVNLDQPGTVDLLSLVNGNSIRLNTDMLPGNVKQLRINLGENNTITLNDTTRSLGIAQQVKDNGLVIFTDMQTNAMYSNSLWLNFDVTSSVVYDANTDKYELQPVVSSFDASSTGAIEGIVSPADAMASIKLHSDQNSRNVLLNTTTVAEPGANGYFKIMGLPEGTYQVDMLAGDGTNRKKSLLLIEVKAGGSTNVGTNVLE